jgi:hypothetical protein
VNAITRAAAASFATLKSVAGVRVTYMQSCEWPLTISFVAVRGRTQMVTNDGGGGMIEARSGDFTASAADLWSNGIFITPSEGDTITITDHASEENGSVFQVMTPPYSPSDHAGTRIRIHTKCINAKRQYR